MTLSELTDNWDQLIPVFMRSVRNARILHYDPAFAYADRLNFLKVYFESKGFVQAGDLQWTSPTMDVKLYARRIEHPADDGLLAELVEEAIAHSTKLVIQEFTGQELQPTLKQLYASCSSRASFKRHVLLDMTYGTDCHCMTDMVKCKPLYTREGDFVNFRLYSKDEILSHIGDSPEMNALIKTYVVKEYLETLNLQVDYRRRCQGDTVLFGTESYGDTSTPDEIMAYIQSRLTPSLHLLDVLGVMTEAKWEKVWFLFDNYKTYNMYDWNTVMMKMVAV